MVERRIREETEKDLGREWIGKGANLLGCVLGIHPSSVSPPSLRPRTSSLPPSLTSSFPLSLPVHVSRTSC